MLWAGFIILVPIAQLLGHRPLLMLIFAEDYTFALKQTIEETLELCGYLVCLAGMSEIFLEERSRPKEKFTS